MAGDRDPQPHGAGFYYLDHLTHNVMRGNMDTWYRFYATAFNFKEIKFFDIQLLNIFRWCGYCMTDFIRQHCKKEND